MEKVNGCANNACVRGESVLLLLLLPLSPSPPVLLLSQACCYLLWKVSPVFNEVPESSEREAICILKRLEPEVGSVAARVDRKR